jgi:orotate phosphoribosyltransferase
MTHATLIHALLRIGAIQFGQFEAAPGCFQPAYINLRLLPSYPATLRALADALVPLARGAGQRGLTHLLAMPAATPIGVALALAADVPLAYPAPADLATLEGAFDYNVPTLLLTDVLTDGGAEMSMIRHARQQGLHVEGVLSIFRLSDQPLSADRLLREAESLWGAADVLALAAAQTPYLGAAVGAWLESLTEASPGSSPAPTRSPHG